MSAEEPGLMAPKNIALLGALLFTALILGEFVFPRTGDTEVAEAPDTVEDVLARIEPVVSFAAVEEVVAALAATAAMADMSPAQIYEAACLACHTTGAAGAPKIGDTGAWTARLEKGIDMLVSNAINGIGAMPARGGSQFDDDQIRQAVQYMLDESQ